MRLSPCVNICTMDDSGLCIGCGRTLDEIAGWLSLPQAKREAIMLALPERLAKLMENQPRDDQMEARSCG